MGGVTLGARDKSFSVQVARRSPFLFFIASLVFALVRSGIPADQTSFRFAILGDRTGGEQSGVYEQAWQETKAELPAFVVATGDMVEGLNAAPAPAEWREFERI